MLSSVFRLTSLRSRKTPVGITSSWSIFRQKWNGTEDYDHIRAEVNCPRCSNQMPVLFSNRPLSITAREPGLFQALNLCRNCKTAFYFRPFKLVPLQGSFVELGRIKGDAEGISRKDPGGIRKLNDDCDGDKDDVSGRLERELPTPKEIYGRLDEFVIGQQKAKKVLSVAVYNHYKRIYHSSEKNEASELGDNDEHVANDFVELDKSNVLLIGPTGSGYVGEDVESILYKLLVVESDDLIAYGLIPEFIGRFPILVGLSALDEDQLVEVLMKPKNALGKQYKKMFNMNGVKLYFTETALRLISKKAMAKNTGARGLRAILENILTEAMFEIPNTKMESHRVNAVLVDEEAVGSVDERGCGAKILYAEDEMDRFLAKEKH
ncbi:hypothetical protein GOBAR_DD25522 [Gossypium barbadense]|nr:hypothetical protein GOBAR_DD25522 [Gossypium barbadense]